MAQVKLLKISSDGINLEMDTAADDITLNSYTVTGGGPVLSSTGLDMNNQDVSDVKDLDFNTPATATIDQTSGALIVDDLMFQTKENSMAVGAAVLFPVVTGGTTTTAKPASRAVHGTISERLLVISRAILRHASPCWKKPWNQLLQTRNRLKSKRRCKSGLGFEMNLGRRGVDFYRVFAGCFRFL